MATFPFIRDLNPALDDLAQIVRIIRRHEGDNDAIAASIEKLFNRSGKRKGYTLHSIKANTMSSLREANLGVMTAGGSLTKFGKKLLKLTKDSGEFKSEIARHLILEKGGLAFCRALEVLRTSGRSREQIAEFLAEKYRIDYWRDLNNISSMHNLLEWADVCSKYQLNSEKFKEIAGIDTGDAKNAEELSPEANMLLHALARAGGVAAPGELRRQAEMLSGRRINPHNVPAYGRELEKRGFIHLPGQRGSKTATWQLQKKQQAAMMAKVAAGLSEARPLPDEAFSRTFAELLKAAGAKNTDKRGRALEHLAARICWKLNLQNIEMRKLSDYEIDVRAEARRPIFQKWVMQCKAARNVLGPAPVLREYGIAKLENIPVIAFVVTSGVSDRARSIADQIMKQSNKVVIILDESDLTAIARDENSLYQILERQSEHARAIKMPQKQEEVVEELVGETEEAVAGTDDDDDTADAVPPRRKRRRARRAAK